MASYKVRRNILGKGGAQIGGASNYTTFNTAGRLTMTGTAQVYKDLWLPAVQWWGVVPNQFSNATGGTTATTGSPGTVVPIDIYGGASGSLNNASLLSLPVLAPSTAKDLTIRAATMFFAPGDAATTGSTVATLYYMARDEHETAGSMEVFRLRWRYYGSKGHNNGGRSGSLLYGASALTTGCGWLEVHELGNIDPFSQASPFCVLELAIENGNSCAMDASPDEGILGLKLSYIANSLGTVTT